MALLKLLVTDSMSLREAVAEAEVEAKEEIIHSSDFKESWASIVALRAEAGQAALWLEAEAGAVEASVLLRLRA